jgi:hypothetical protein
MGPKGLKVKMGNAENVTDCHGEAKVVSKFIDKPILCFK